MNDYWSSIDETVVTKLAMQLGNNWSIRNAAERLEREWHSISKSTDWPDVATLGLKPWTIFHSGAIVYLACRFEGNRPVYPIKIGVTTSPGTRIVGLRTEYQTKTGDTGSFGYFGAICVRKEIVARLLERILHKLCRAAAIGSFGVRTTKGEWYFSDPITIWNMLFDPLGGILDSRVMWAAKNESRLLREQLSRIASSSFLRSRDFETQSPLIQDLSEFYWSIQLAEGNLLAIETLGKLTKLPPDEMGISPTSFANAIDVIVDGFSIDATEKLLGTIYWRHFFSAFLWEILIHQPYGRDGGIDFKSVFNLWRLIRIEDFLADYLRPDVNTENQDCTK